MSFTACLLSFLTEPAVYAGERFPSHGMEIARAHAYDRPARQAPGCRACEYTE